MVAAAPVSTSWHSYPSIYNLGHRAVENLFLEPVRIQEKVDGSQFSFGVFNGELRCRSKGKEIVIDAPEKLFNRAVWAVQDIQHLLVDGWTYRAEYLAKPKHNTLSYDRAPNHTLILYDINTAEETYLHYNDMKAYALSLGFEVVPQFFEGVWTKGVEGIRELLDQQSILGGVNIEGLVIKSSTLYGPDKKTLMGKYVSEAFKEIHGTEWKKANPGRGDVVEGLIATFKAEPRWAKAVQHLREAGALDNSPRDIGPLLREVGQDLLKEEADAIKEVLFKWAWPQIQRGATAGLPDWYKNQLLEQQFE